MNGRFVENGADAESFAEVVGNEVSGRQGSLNLLSGTCRSACGSAPPASGSS